MITRSKLAEQLRDYQIRSQHKCPAALTVFSPKPAISSRIDVAVAIFWALLFSVLLVSSYITLYLRHYRISFVIICLAIFLPVRLGISRQTLAKKRERRFMLPLSMWMPSMIANEWAHHSTALTRFLVTSRETQGSILQHHLCILDNLVGEWYLSLSLFLMTNMQKLWEFTKQIIPLTSKMKLFEQKLKEPSCPLLGCDVFSGKRKRKRKLLLLDF